jgi:hypothetical protein
VTDCVGPDVWFDETSALCWQNPPELAPLLAATAVDYCDGLQLGGHADWRLPDISELRSLIRGCPTTALGGACGVTATCTGIECEDDEDCAGCGFQGGPAADGCYWDAALSGPCSVPAWSSSPEVNDYVWAIAFDGAYMGVAAILIKKHDARQAVWGAPWRSLRRSGC